MDSGELQGTEIIVDGPLSIGDSMTALIFALLGVFLAASIPIFVSLALVAILIFFFYSSIPMEILAPAHVCRGGRICPAGHSLFHPGGGPYGQRRGDLPPDPFRQHPGGPFPRGTGNLRGHDLPPFRRHNRFERLHRHRRGRHSLPGIDQIGLRYPVYPRASSLAPPFWG